MRDFVCESEVFNGPKCKKQCARCRVKPKPRRESALSGYEIRTGADGKVGIYTRDYNCRLATFNANTYQLQQALSALFNRVHERQKKHAGAKRLREAGVRRSKTAPVNPRAKIGEKGYYAAAMPTRP